MNNAANDNDFRIIPLSLGQVTLVDADDYAWLSRWSWSAVPARSRAGRFYATRTGLTEGRKTRVLMHRVVMDAQPGQVVDHVNGDPLDNRRRNLRFCTIQQNRWNCLGHGASSGFIGVTHRPLNPHRPFYAGIKVDGRTQHLGAFASAEEAARAYDAAALAARGAFARLNFPQGEQHDAA